jgi:hypothetical protein
LLQKGISIKTTSRKTENIFHPQNTILCLQIHVASRFVALKVKSVELELKKKHYWKNITPMAFSENKLLRTDVNNISKRGISILTFK